MTTDLTSRILGLLRLGIPMTTVEIAKTLSVRLGKVHNAIYPMQRWGDVRRTGFVKTGKQRNAIWTLPPEALIPTAEDLSKRACE